MAAIHDSAGQPADRRRTDVRATSAGEADVRNRFAELGLTPRTGWYTSVALYAVGAIPTIALPLIDPAHFSQVFLWLGLMALLIAVLSVVGLRYFPNSIRATHIRLTIGLMIQTFGAVAVGDARQAFAMLPLVTILPPAIYFGVRAAAIYALLATGMVTTCLMLLTEPWAFAMAVCTTTALVTVASSMMIAQTRTRRMAREYRRLAYTDPLTGLANARSLQEGLATGLENAVATREPLALFAIDLDNFKTVNDRLGYAVGDDLLIAVGDALARTVSRDGLVARRGGDEFSVLLSASAKRDPDRLSGELGDAIRRVRTEVCPSITPSASVAFVLSKPADGVGSILERADDALHEKKLAFHVNDTVATAPRPTTFDRRLESERAGGEQHPLPEGQHRRAGDRHPHAAVSHWWRGSTAIDRPIWFFAATMQLVIGLALISVALLGWAIGFSAADGVTYGGAMLALVVLSLIAARAPLSRRLVHVPYVGSLVVLTLAVVSAGSSGVALLDLFVILALFGFHFFEPRAAAVYLVSALALYGYLAIAGSFPYAEARLTVMSLVVLSSAVLVAKVRSVASRYVVQNWELSQRDGLTGAANVRALRARLEHLAKRANAGKTAAGLIAIDLDEFKQVNDCFSHSAGDAMLIAVTRSIDSNTRAEDLVARRGGDEFVIVVEAVGRDELDRLAARIGASIAHTRSRMCANLPPDTSVVCVYVEHGDDGDRLLARSDAALHERKLESRLERMDAVA